LWIRCSVVMMICEAYSCDSMNRHRDPKRRRNDG
jgi:hypothetical protein